MNRIHQHIEQKYPWYRQWHQDPRHQVFHWFLMVLFALISFSIVQVSISTSFNYAVAASIIEVYPGPGVNTYESNLYSVEVFDGSSWIPSYVYKYSRTSVTHWHQGATPSVNFITLGTNGPVNVRITKIGDSITSADVSPKSKNIPVTITSGQATLTLNQNNKTWITINGDDANPLFIFADAPKPTVPSGATYFGPGIHEIAPAMGNHYQASNNEVIYLDGGAWVKGNIIATGISNVQIMGPGVLSGELWDPATIQQLPWDQFQNYFMIYGGQYGVVNSGSVKGITVIASPAYNIFSMSSAYSVKILSPWYYQTDGFSVIDTDQSFAFNGDTTFHLETGYWSPIANGYTVNLRVTNSFAGNTNNSVFLGGFWGNPPSATFTSLADNIDIKTYNSDAWVQSGAPLTPVVFQNWVDNTDSTYGHSNQTYQNIRIEGNIGAPLAQIKNIVYPWPGSPAPNPPLGNSYNLMFKNISVSGTQKGLSEIKGLDANNGFRNVTFENLTINGTLITSSNANSYFATNSYVWGPVFGSSPSDTIAPIISFTAPVEDASLSGSGIILSATASDTVGVVVVQFKVDGVNIGSEDTVAPYSVSWNSTTVTNGGHTLTAVARDAAGNTTTATRAVTVSNPAISSLSPTSGLVGTVITIAGSGFTATGNTVHFGVGGKLNVSSSGTSINYTIPNSVSGCDFWTSSYSCTRPVSNVPPGAYSLYVSNANGTSNAVNFAVTAAVALPSVIITAPDASASEAGLATSSYTLSRTGPTTQSLPVTVAVSGTATRDIDYILTGSGINGGTRQIATIPVGSTTTNILLTPKQDTLKELTETVVITLVDGASYNLGTPRSATVRIADND